METLKLATFALSCAVFFVGVSAAEKEKVEKIALISTSIGSGKEYCDLSGDNHKQYATAHGYAYFRYNEAEIASSGDPKWAKLTAIRKHMGTGHEHVLWVDCDIVFTNMDKPLSSIISQYGSADLVIARDAWWRKANAGEDAGGPPNVINSGLMLFKDNQWSIDLVEQVHREGKVPGTQLEDQPRIITILMNTGQLNIPATEETELHEHTAIVSQRVMNSFLRDGEAYNAEDPPESRWRPGDLCAHVTGMPIDMRVRIINDLLRDSSKRSIPAAMRTLLENSIPGLATLIAEATKTTSKASQQEQVGLLPEISSMLTQSAVETFENNLKSDLIRVLTNADGVDLQKVKELTLTEWFVGEQEGWKQESSQGASNIINGTAL